MIERRGARPHLRRRGRFGGRDVALAEGLQRGELAVVEDGLGAGLDFFVAGFNLFVSAAGIARFDGLPGGVRARELVEKDLLQLHALVGLERRLGAHQATGKTVELRPRIAEQRTVLGRVHRRQVDQHRQHEQAENLFRQPLPGELVFPGEQPDAAPRAEERGLQDQCFGSGGGRVHVVTLSKMFFNDRLWLRMPNTVTWLSKSKPVQRA